MHPSAPLPEVLVLLAAAIMIVVVFRRLNLSPVLGYLVVGAAIGPHGFVLIENVAPMQIFAEFGVVFLLFLIGLELSFERLRIMRSQVFGFGTAQVVITAAIIGGCMLLQGFDKEVVLIVAGGLALSSTALVLQMMEETGLKASQTGRLSFAVLLLQDLAVVPLLVLVPLLAEQDAAFVTALTSAGVRAAVALVVIFIIGRSLIRPLFKLIASLHNAEIFVATTLLVVLGISWITAYAGLSLALGAFMAGLLVAETEYKHQVEADIRPYKRLLMGLFFMVVGMSVDWHFVVERYGLIIGASLALIMVKTTVLYFLCRAMKFERGTSIHTGLLLSQGGEFAFVLFGLAAEKHILSDSLEQTLLVIVTVTMALTPLANMLGRSLARYFEGEHKPTLEQCQEQSLDLSNHVVVAGYGRVGQTIGKLLAAEDVAYLALDLDPAIVTRARKLQSPVVYGDVGRAEILEAVGIARARAVILTVNDFTSALRAVRAIRSVSKDIPIVARSSDVRQLVQLEESGANIAVSEMYEGSLQLGGALLKTLGVADHEITRIVGVFRAQDYALTCADALQMPKKTIS